MNTSFNDIQAHLSDDAETLYYYSGNRPPPDGVGMDDIWLIRRENLQDNNGSANHRPSSQAEHESPESAFPTDTLRDSLRRVEWN